MAGLSDIQVIETLDGYGFTRMDMAPWRGENPDEWDAYPVDIIELPDFGRRRDDQLAAPEDLGDRGWESVAERINDASKGRPIHTGGTFALLCHRGLMASTPLGEVV